MNNLRFLRESRGLSQQKLGEKFNLSQQSVYKYENQLAEPDISTLMRLAEFFHTSVDYLIGYSPNSKHTEPPTLEAENLSPNELHHLAMYRNLNTSSQKYLDSLLEDIAPDDDYITKFK